MCGIVGVFRTDTYGCGWKEKEVFQDLLICNAVRGIDGTGVFIVNEENAVRTLKIGNHPFALLQSKDWSKFYTIPYEASKKRIEDRIIIGHNRFKTTGNASTEHAHPHKSGDIFLVHNGTLMAYSSLPNLKNFAVDSQGLASAINTLGIKEAIARTHGSYAIIYYNQKDNTLNMIRNGERPLAMAVNQTFSRIFFASEPRMLKWILNRNNIPDNEIEIGMLKEDIHYTWHPKELQPKMEKMEGAKIYTTFNRGSIPWSDALETEMIDPWDMDNRMSKLPEHQKQQIANSKEKKVLKDLRKIGIKAKPLDALRGIKKMENLVFRVDDYMDEDPAAETFIVTGTSKTLPDTIIRFRIQGIRQVEALFENPDVISVVRNIVEYEDADPTKGEDRYGIWVSHVNLYVPSPDQPDQSPQNKHLPVLVK